MDTCIVFGIEADYTLYQTLDPMKTLSTTLLLVLFLSIGNLFTSKYAYAQRHGRQYLHTILGGGYHQVNVKADGLNYVIDQFNQTRRLTGDQAMAKVERLTGFSSFLGTYGYLGRTPFLLEFRYGNAGQTLTATERPPGQPPIDHELRFNMHNIQLGLGLMATSSEYFGIGIGIAPDIGINTINDKTGAGSAEIVNNFNSGVSFFLPVYALLGPIMLGVRPYYTLQLGSSDYTELNASLNPSTYQTNPADAQNSTMNHFGIEFRVGLLLSKRERR
ncbi:hypothetical protein [Microscilla marina]|uniref:Outer membrane protein beta-barrel domain-containing protein n=1 Tax=Microscilla marina ATCC 23134 TaxID=313606 RepID=A1ZY63_MICM2|nr:hypothetical protein [Microscilla marina]EAY24629.1 hypothetical protein M23134_00581 [Microscilla marina ATCC 23134]